MMIRQISLNCELQYIPEEKFATVVEVLWLMMGELPVELDVSRLHNRVRIAS
jgi:hypothetical protein